MLRHVGNPVETPPRFERVLRRRTWHEWPGIAGIATGVALWIFLAMGVVLPLGEALARLRPPAGTSAAVCPPVEGVLAASAQNCACDCPEPPPPAHARRG
jgi:hypothetical protein